MDERNFLNHTGIHFAESGFDLLGALVVEVLQTTSHDDPEGDELGFVLLGGCLALQMPYAEPLDPTVGEFEFALNQVLADLNNTNDFLVVGGEENRKSFA